jgi:hypothetical protein
MLGSCVRAGPMGASFALARPAVLRPRAQPTGYPATIYPPPPRGLMALGAFVPQAPSVPNRIGGAPALLA